MLSGVCKSIRFFLAEALIWSAGLLILAIYNPGQPHFAICLFQFLGFDFCPGCGLGRSVSLFFHGEILQSLKVHPLGIFATIVLSFRIVKLLKLYLKSPWQE
jgi:hypothetical protein